MFPLFFATWVAISRVEDYVSIMITRACFLEGFRHLAEASYRGRGRRGDDWSRFLTCVLPHVLAQPLLESLSVSPIRVRGDGRSNRTSPT